MRASIFLIALAAAAAAWGAAADGPVFQFPQIRGYGGIVSLPDAAEPPQAGAKVVFDITAESAGDEVNKGLESVARYLNLHADAGLKKQEVQLALVLHGGATKAALQDEAYAQHAKTAANPNLKLIRELRQNGVEVYVCGQALARNKFAARDVAPEVAVAVSAMTVNVNKQLGGYAYMTIR